MPEFSLKGELKVTFDLCDLPLVSAYRWWAAKRGKAYYAVANVKKDGRWQQIYMHRLLLGMAAVGLDVDHIDGNGLNNSRVNLRAVTRAQNLFNTHHRRPHTSQYKGVSKLGNRWRAQLSKRLGGVRVNLLDRCFVSEQEAAKAYNEAAQKAFCEFAQLNKIKENV